MQTIMNRRKRIVVKVGSNVLTREDDSLDVTRISSLVDQLAWLHKRGYDVILVSSGAVASGHSELSVEKKLDSVEQRQLFSAIGQVKLINLYYDLFREYQIPIGQVLTMKKNFTTRREYNNQRACINVMLENGVIPIVNENDTVCVTELMFTDNDELSGLIATMMDAEELILLSCVDGVFDGKEGDETAQLVKRVEPDADITSFLRQDKSRLGRGGMQTKCSIARQVAEKGVRVFIANGKRDNILIDIVCKPEETPHTEFIPHGLPV